MPARSGACHSGRMQASELVEQVPTVQRDTTGAEAARVVAEYRLTGLVVVDDAGAPIAIVPGSQILGLVLPQYVRDDPKLAHAYDEEGADSLCQVLNTVTVGELLDAKRLSTVAPPAVRPDATLIEVAVAMDRGHLPLILVRSVDGSYLGVVTMSRVLAAIATAAGEDSALIRRRLEQDIIAKPTLPEREGNS